jgi:hypothetical protein
LTFLYSFIENIKKNLTIEIIGFMKKDLILITCFVPDEKRQQMLRDLIYNINKDDYDIMISSHSRIPEDVFNKIDFFVYEKENALDFKYSNKFHFFYGSSIQQIKTTEPKKYNHFIPVIRHIISGLIYARSLGYKKVHYFEYDSLIKNDKELKENSKLLDEYSAVYYQPKHLPYPNSPISFNLDEISEKWFDLDYANFESFLKKPKSTRLVEEYEWDLLNSKGKIYKKDFQDLSDNQIYAALNSDIEKNKWIVPVYKKENNSINIFSWVENEEDAGSDVVVVVNDSKVIKINRPFRGYWSLDLLGDISEIKKIKIIVDDQVSRKYEFNEETINEFIVNNFII